MTDLARALRDAESCLSGGGSDGSLVDGTKGNMMRIRTVILGSSVGAMVMALALSVFAVVLLVENREWRSSVGVLRAELDQARGEVRASSEERETANAELAAQRERVEGLSAALVLLEGAAKEAREGVTVRMPVQSHRVRAYLGNQQVGMAWLVPNRLRTNAVDGQVSYEPVIVLGESVREQVGLTRTNVVEREVSLATTVNYHVPQVYGSGWSVHWVKPGGSRPGTGPSPPVGAQPGSPPSVPSPYLSTRTWHPQGGWTQGAAGRPGGEWISSGTRSVRGTAGPAKPAGSTSFPARY